MKKSRSGFFIGIIAGILLPMVIVSAFGQNAEDNPDSTLGFTTSGHQYLPKGSNFRVGYVAGTLDAFLFTKYLASRGKQVFDFNDCKDKWTKYELMLVVERYIHDHENERQYSAALLSHKALMAKCQDQVSPSD